MSFLEKEESREAGQPYQLFIFRANAQTYRYTTLDTEVVVGTTVYSPDQPMESVVVEETAEDSKGKLNFKVMRDHEVAQLFMITSPPTISLTILAGHVGEEEHQVIWTGRVVGCHWDEEDKGTISCESLRTVLSRTGLVYKFGPLCQHTLYRGGCKLDLFANSMEIPVASKSGYHITFGGAMIGAPTNEYNGGLVIRDNVEYRMIVDYDPAIGKVTLIRPFENLEDGEILRVARGCDRTPTRCQELGNFENILAFSTVPRRNPFKGLREAGVLAGDGEP